MNATSAQPYRVVSDGTVAVSIARRLRILMNTTSVLFDILVVLLAAKLAAEVAERLKIPAVVGEILAGVAVGPSVLHLVGSDDVLRTLGEIGVILLLLEVGLEMDLAELGAVGRASLAVATIGVIVPFAGGFGLGMAFGWTGNEALFIGAALTATSVGITARVFGDLRALAMVEARTVLGAAVADDVMGLVILTVVVRLVSEGSVEFSTVGAVVGIAVAFLLIASFLGVRFAPGLFSLVSRYSRSSGTLVALALAFTLAVSELASLAKLAPIVGAFVAGLSLARSPVAGRIQRELTPVGHLFIPVFFLQIGIDADVSQFASPAVLGVAGAMLVVAVVGKLVSAAGLFGSPGDRLLVGIGMIPRGEVGLIFATIGLQQGIIGQDLYASLLLVVLVTTLLTPPFLRLRLMRIRAGTSASTVQTSTPPDEGWLTIREGPTGGTVELNAEPAPGAALAVALEAALLGDHDRPGASLLDWLSRQPQTPLRWNDAARAQLFRLLEHGGPRAWRFLAITGVLDRALPELGEAITRRQSDAHELDPTGALRWPLLSRLHESPVPVALAHPERLWLAAVVLDAAGEEGSPVVIARRVVKRLDLGAAAEEAVAGLVGDVALLRGSARRPDSLAEENVLQLAVHLGSSEQASGLFALTLASDDLDAAEVAQIQSLHDLIQAALQHPELTDRTARNAVEQRRAEASRLTSDREVQERIETAPRAFVLASAPADLARQAALCEPLVGRTAVRVLVVELASAGEWRVELVARDRVGLIARYTDVLAAQDYNIFDALVATWGDGCALASFGVTGVMAPDPLVIEREVLASLDEPLGAPPIPDATLTFDDTSSPWHTICEVKAPDRAGLLHGVTAAFALAGASVHWARIKTAEGHASDVFELTDANGRKLDAGRKERISQIVAAGFLPRRRGFRWPFGGRSVATRNLGAEVTDTPPPTTSHSEVSESTTSDRTNIP